MQYPNRVNGGSSWLLEEILNCTAHSAKYNCHHTVQLLTFPGDPRVYISDGIHYIRADFITANINAVDERHNLLESWPPGTILHLRSYYYDFNVGLPGDELAFSLVVEHFFDDGNTHLNNLPASETLCDMCAFADKSQVTKPTMEEGTEGAETVATPVVSLLKGDREDKVNDDGKNSYTTLQANNPDEPKSGDDRQIDVPGGATASLSKSIRMDDLVVTSSQLNQMTFSFQDVDKDDAPSRSESVSELFEELGKESSSEEQPLREKKAKLKRTHIFKSGDRKSKQMLHTPLKSVDHLMVSPQEEWQLSLITEWMPGYHLQLSCSESPSLANDESLSRREPELFLQPTLRSDRSPSSHASAVMAKKLGDVENGTVLGKTRHVADVTDISKNNVAAHPLQKIGSHSQQPPTEKGAEVLSSPPTVGHEGIRDDCIDRLAGEGKTSAEKEDSGSLFSETDGEDAGPFITGNEAGSEERRQMHHHHSKSRADIEKIKKIILNDADGGGMRGQDASGPQDLLSCQGRKGGTVFDSSKLYKVLKKVMPPSKASASHPDPSPQAVVRRPQSSAGMLPQNLSSKSPKKKACAVDQCLDSIDQYSFDDSMERRYEMVDQCLVGVFQHLAGTVASHENSRNVPVSTESVTDKKPARDEVVVANSKPKQPTIDTLFKPQQSCKPRKSKLRLYPVEQKSYDVESSGAEQRKKDNRSQARAQHPLSLLFSKQAHKQRTAVPLQLKREKEIFSETRNQTQENVRQTAPTQRKRSHAVAIKNVPSNCPEVVEIKRGIVLSNDVLTNIELMRLLPDAQTTIKEEVVNSSDDASEVSFPTSEKERKSARNKGGPAMRNALERVIRPKRTCSKPTNTSKPSLSGGRELRSRPGQKTVASTVLPAESQGFMPRLESSEAFSQDDSW